MKPLIDESKYTEDERFRIYLNSGLHYACVNYAIETVDNKPVGFFTNILYEYLPKFLNLLLDTDAYIFQPTHKTRKNLGSDFRRFVIAEYFSGNYWSANFSGKIKNIDLNHYLDRVSSSTNSNGINEYRAITEGYGLISLENFVDEICNGGKDRFVEILKYFYSIKHTEDEDSQIKKTLKLIFGEDK